MNAPAKIPPAVRTTCPYCGVGCGVSAKPEANGGTIITGDPDHPANFGKLCSKGFALDETLGLRNRLLHPMLRQPDGGLSRTDWDTALATVADGFRRIAMWIRKNCRYVQESYGIEKLQGPYSTLRSRVMDCDDGAILWTTLCRAIGLNAVAVGVGNGPENLGHMVGMNANTGRLYELSTGDGYEGLKSNSPDALLLDQGKWWLETSHDGQTITGWQAEVKKTGHTIPVGVALVSGAAFALLGMRENDDLGVAIKRFAVGAGVAIVGGMLISTQLDETIHE